MKTRIKDEFTGLAVSRQRKYQMRMLQQQRCIICGKPSATAAHCLFHAIKYREQRRAKLNVRRRYYGARTYELQSRNGDIEKGRWAGRASRRTGINPEEKSFKSPPPDSLHLSAP